MTEYRCSKCGRQCELTSLDYGKCFACIESQVSAAAKSEDFGKAGAVPANPNAWPNGVPPYAKEDVAQMTGFEPPKFDYSGRIAAPQCSGCGERGTPMTHGMCGPCYKLACMGMLPGNCATPQYGGKKIENVSQTVGRDEYNRIPDHLREPHPAREAAYLLPGIKDSGERVKHTTGAVRDSAAGRGRYDLISPIMMERLAKHLEAGAAKYEERNWEKGLPICRMFASMFRHSWQAFQGYTDEDHMAAVICNAMFIMHTLEMIVRGALPANLDDRPHYGLVPPGEPDIRKSSRLNDADAYMIRKPEKCRRCPHPIHPGEWCKEASGDDRCGCGCSQ